MDLVFSDTRAKALSDGWLIDVTKEANKAGLPFPTALTRVVWERFVRVPDGIDSWDESGRLWDIVSMLWCEVNLCETWYDIGRELADGELQGTFVLELWVSIDLFKTEFVTLTAICGPGDNLEPVFTVMLPEEELPSHAQGSVRATTESNHDN